MWKQDIIHELFKETIKVKGVLYKMDIGEAYPHVKEGLPILKEFLPKTDCYYMGTLDLTVKLMGQFEKNAEQMKSNYDYENIHFPKKYTLWEYSLPKGGRHGIKKEALYVLDEDNKIFIWPLIFSPEFKIWIPGMYWVFLFKNPAGTMKLVGPNDLKEEEIEDFEETGRRVVSYVLTFLKILSCKNVKQETVTSYLTKQKRYGNRPLYPYKMVRVKSIKSYEEDPDSSDYENISFCRGHFKQYFPDKPLLGKYTGLYWWDPHLREDE